MHKLIHKLNNLGSNSESTLVPSVLVVDYKLDTDGDGSVSFDEFLVLIRQSLDAVRARKLGNAVRGEAASSPLKADDIAARCADLKRKGTVAFEAKK